MIESIYQEFPANQGPPESRVFPAFRRIKLVQSIRGESRPHVDHAQKVLQASKDGLDFQAMLAQLGHLGKKDAMGMMEHQVD